MTDSTERNTGVEQRTRADAIDPHGRDQRGGT